MDGICTVSLAPIRTTDLVLPTIAQSLGFNRRRNMLSLAQIQVAIQDKHFLLLLDNFEHIVEAASQLKELLSACPNLKILVTSRTVLRLSEERVFSITPLALPDLAHLPSSCEKLSQIPAVSLLLQRARTAAPDFVLTNDNAHAVAQICVRLDGLPLALELAASLLKLFSPQSLLMRLGRPLTVLTWGSVMHQSASRHCVRHWSGAITCSNQRNNAFFVAFSFLSVAVLCRPLKQ
jgi:predicted ATPase